LNVAQTGHAISMAESSPVCGADPAARVPIGTGKAGLGHRVSGLFSTIRHVSWPRCRRSMECTTPPAEVGMSMAHGAVKVQICNMAWRRSHRSMPRPG